MYGRLKSLVVASVLIGLGAASAAVAADLPLKARPMAAAPLYNWTGCYLGANVGGGWTRLNTAACSTSAAWLHRTTTAARRTAA
jgi:outer membrane immunogenic protein